MQTFDLETPLITITKGREKAFWTIRHSFQHLLCVGSTGSGKTSSVGRLLATKMLKAGYGFCILTAKKEERALWETYCAETGRNDDLIIVSPGQSKHVFDFVSYEAQARADAPPITDNLVKILQEVIQAGEEKSGGKSDDPFWTESLTQLIAFSVDMCRLAYGTVTVEQLYDFVQSIPQQDGTAKSDKDSGPSAFEKAFKLASKNVNDLVDRWQNSLPKGQLELFKINPALYEAAMLDALADARTLRFADSFFITTYINLNPRTRSIIDFSFGGLLFKLLRDPVFSLFCKGPSTFTPEDAIRGKIILLDLPTQIYGAAGRSAQLLFKVIFQRAMERRTDGDYGRPVALWTDEYQEFTVPSDAAFQGTARSSRVAVVGLTQSLPTLFAVMGGQRAEHRVKSLLGNFNSKVFLSQADTETNRYSSELIGDAQFEEVQRTVTVSGQMSTTKNYSLKIDKAVRPEEFSSLLTGGPANDLIVSGIMHHQGSPLISGLNYCKLQFSQLSANNDPALSTAPTLSSIIQSL